MKGYANYGQLEHLQEFVPSTKCKRITSYILGVVSKPINPFPLVIFASSRVSCSCVFWFDWMEIMICKYECGYGSEDHHEDPNHMRSIKHGCLAHFFIKRLYTWLDVVEITFYHWTHIRANGDPIHGACDLRSTSWMSTYAPRMSHKLKEFIWTQLGLSYTMKQIYDKHKDIWWAQANAGEWMTWDDLLWLQNIAYLDWKCKRGT